MLSSHVEWADDPDTWGTDRSPFTPRTALRKLRVVIDAHLFRLPDSPETVSPEEVLSSLLMHKYVRFFRYADEGPPPDVKANKVEGWGEAYEGWVTVDPRDEQPDSRGLVYVDKSGPVFGTAYVDPHRGARHDTTTSAYADLPQNVAADKREADALALQVALGVDADIFITNRPYLYQARFGSLPVKLLRPRDALAIVGLYLRSQGVYTVYRDQHVNFTMNWGVYFRVGALELLPAIWRWSGACGGSGDDTLNELAWSLIRRVQRALEARDRLHRVLNRAQNNDTAAAALSSFDVVLLLLMAACDVTARIAHHILGLGGKAL